MYIFDTQYGHCSLADEETNIVILWDKGKFNKTQEAKLTGVSIPKGEDPAKWLARKVQEMRDYIIENYPELI